MGSDLENQILVGVGGGEWLGGVGGGARGENFWGRPPTPMTLLLLAYCARFWVSVSLQAKIRRAPIITLEPHEFEHTYPIKLLRAESTTIYLGGKWGGLSRGSNSTNI